MAVSVRTRWSRGSLARGQRAERLHLLTSWRACDAFHLIVSKGAACCQKLRQPEWAVPIFADVRPRALASRWRDFPSIRCSSAAASALKTVRQPEAEASLE